MQAGGGRWPGSQPPVTDSREKVQSPEAKEEASLRNLCPQTTTLLSRVEKAQTS